MNISLRSGVLFPSPENITTLFFYRISITVIIHLSLMLKMIVLLVFYHPPRILNIYCSVRYHMRMWLILCYMICWSQCNSKIVRSVMTLVQSVGSNMKWIATLTHFLIPLIQIVFIKYTYGFLNQPMAQNILWRVTIFPFSKILCGIGGY